MERQVERAPLAGEVLAELLRGLAQHGMVARHDAALPFAGELAQLGFERAAIDELQQLESLVAGDREHRPERRLDPRGNEERRRMPRAAGCVAEYAGERFAEAAVGVEPGVEPGVE